MQFDYDPELPGGFQDADFEMRDLQDAADRAVRLRRAGKCQHGYRQGYNGGKTPGLQHGQFRCLDCGVVFSGT